MKAQEIRNRTGKLIDVAMGRDSADIVLKNGKWVCVQTAEIIPHMDIAIKGERIAFVGSDASHTIGSETAVFDANGQYLVPGLLDAHMHIESSMLTMSEFVKTVAPLGTTGIFVDPHEITNVFGLDGVRLMVDEAKSQPIHVWVQMPSCVPSSPGFETPGASIEADDVAKAMQWDGIIGLGEVMNYPGVYNNDEKMISEIAETRSAGKVVGGHYASPDLGLPFHGYVASGAEDDHEGTRIEDAVQRARQGMKPMLRYGSAWHDVANQVGAILDLHLDPRRFILCTDDSHSETLVTEGHMDRVLRRAIHLGLPPMTALQMATINTAEHFGLSKDLGMIAPGRFADILIIKDLHELKANLVFAKGKLIAKDGKYLSGNRTFTYPDWVTHSVKPGKSFEANDFQVKALPEYSSVTAVTANIIEIIENQAPTKHLRETLPVIGNSVQTDITRDIAKLAVIERHHQTGRIQVGFVKGFHFDKPCAVGSTVAHDCHQMIIAGTNESDMAIAANKLIEMQGGQVVVIDGTIVGEVPLPIAGLMSDKPAKIVASQAASVLEGFRECGCDLNNPNMQLSLLGLVVIPELRLSDLGLVDVNHFKFIPVIETK